MIDNDKLIKELEELEVQLFVYLLIKRIVKMLNTPIK